MSAAALTLWRIGREDRPVWDGTGAALHGGRWNPPGRAVIYAADSHALALLEVVVNAQAGRPPTASVVVTASVPPGVAERVGPGDVAGWDAPDRTAAQAFGARWLSEGRSAVLLVPSAVSPPDRNAVVNPAHPEAARLSVSTPLPLDWEPRLARLLAG